MLLQLNKLVTGILERGLCVVVAAGPMLTEALTAALLHPITVRFKDFIMSLEHFAKLVADGVRRGVDCTNSISSTFWFFNHVTLSAIKSAKVQLKEIMYWKFCFQASNDI